MDGGAIQSSGIRAADGVVAIPGSSWHIAGISDFNGDSQSDILWRNDNGALAEWLMNGTRIVASVTPSLGGTAVSPEATWSTQAKPTNFG